MGHDGAPFADTGTCRNDGSTDALRLRTNSRVARRIAAADAPEQGHRSKSVTGGTRIMDDRVGRPNGTLSSPPAPMRLRHTLYVGPAGAAEPRQVPAGLRNHIHRLRGPTAASTGDGPGHHALYGGPDVGFRHTVSRRTPPHRRGRTPRPVGPPASAACYSCSLRNQKWWRSPSDQAPMMSWRVICAHAGASARMPGSVATTSTI